MLTLDEVANYADILAVPLAIIGVILIIRQLNLSLAESEREHLRRQKEMTLEAYGAIRGDLRKAVKNIRNALELEDMFDKFEQKHLEMILNDKRLRGEVIKMLALINKFAVGVKHDVFNLELVNDLAGRLFIETYNQFEPYIKHVRKDSPKFYVEYERMVKRLKQLQNEDSGQVIF